MSSKIEVKVTDSGVQFGGAWFSHERITGYTAEQLNSGNCCVTGREYMKWLTTASPVVERQPLIHITTQVLGMLKGELRMQSGGITFSEEKPIGNWTVPLYEAPPELAELQATIARLTAENERLKGGQGEKDSTLKINIEVRECEGCNHIGIDDQHETMGACHECDWSGPDPVEDKCPGCERENVMAAACPDCGSRYVLATSKTIEIQPLFASQPAPVAVDLPFLFPHYRQEVVAAIEAAGGTVKPFAQPKVCECPPGVRNITDGGHFPACTACKRRLK